MADSVLIYGFGQFEDPFIERPPMTRAQFHFPEGVTLHSSHITPEYVELRIRIPLIADSEADNA
jgi:hypothetical protein